MHVNPDSWTLHSLQYACDLEAEVIGKPSSMFFQSVLNDMGLQPHEVCHNRWYCIPGCVVCYCVLPSVFYQGWNLGICDWDCKLSTGRFIRVYAHCVAMLQMLTIKHAAASVCPCAFTKNKKTKGCCAVDWTDSLRDAKWRLFWFMLHISPYRKAEWLFGALSFISDWQILHIGFISFCVSSIVQTYKYTVHNVTSF